MVSKKNKTEEKNKQGSYTQEHKYKLLQKQYNLLQKLIDNISDHIYVKDKKNRYVYVNKAKADFLGIKPKDFIGKTDFDFFPSENAKLVSKNDKLVIKNKKPINNIYINLSHKKKEFWLSCNKIPWFDKNGNIKGVMGISREVTQIKKMTDDALYMENIFKALMDNVPDSIYFKDKKSRFVLINKALSDKFGLGKPEDAIGLSDFDFFEEKLARPRFNGEQRVIKEGKPFVEHEKVEIIEGRPEKWVASTKVPWYDINNKIIGIMGITRDITEKRKAEEKVKYLSFHDMLTGLFNRAYFEEEIKRLDTGRQLPLTIVMGDVNGLKLMNDAYGHNNGDTLLRKISAILKESFRKEDIVSRWGGDEFIAILPKTSTSNTEDIIKRIREKCKKGSTSDMPLSISLGVSTKTTAAQDIEKILKEAEDRMYKNKVSESEEINEAYIDSFKKKIRKKDSRDEKLLNKIQGYAVRIGERLNLSKLKLEELKFLMNLHNIGKLALADEVLSKPGTLNREEWKIVKKLPEIGYRIAESSEQLKPIAEAILSHHEWYNGKGYPRGIKGDDIPILSRISFLMNSFEAMTRDRPYRKKMTYDEAINEIKKYSGVQFDPKIVNIFLDLIEGEKEKIKKS